MSDKNKTKAQLIEEMAALRERNAELETREAEHQRSEQVQAALYRIADAASAVEDMQEFYAAMHQIVGELMNAKNFFIALWDEAAQMVNIPYMFDEFHAPTGTETLPVPMAQVKQGLTGYIIRTEKPLHASSDKKVELTRQGEIEPVGTNSVDWLGVPFKTDEGVIGALVVQSYTEGTTYTDQDLTLLNFVGQHIATALERARLFDETNHLLAETQQRNAELTVINTVQQGLVAQIEMQAIYDLVGDQIRDIFDAQVVLIATFDHEAGLEHFNYNIEKGARFYPEPRPIDAFRRQLISTGQPALVNENIEQFLLEIFGQKPDVFPGTELPKSILFVPLSVGEMVNGYVSLQNVDHEHAFSDSDVRLLTTIGNSMSIALENARLFDETQRLLKETEERNAELSIINSVQAGLVAELDIQAIYDLVGDQIYALFKAPIVVISGIDQEAELIDYHYVFENDERVYIDPQPMGPVPKHVVATKKVFHVGTQEEEIAITGKKPVYIEDTAVTQSRLDVPLIIGGTVKGLIGLQDEQKHAFSDSDVRLLTTLANSMSIALENARLFAETQQRNTELATINTVSQAIASELELEALINLVGEQMRQTFNADIVYVALHNRHTDMVEFPYYFGDESPPMPFGEGLTSRIIETREPLLINEEVTGRAAEMEIESPGKEALSYLGVPITIGQQAIGVISVQSTTQEGRFNQTDLNLLNTIAANVGIALENARLFAEVQTRNQEIAEALQQQTATSEILHAMADSPGDIQPVFDAIAKNAANLAGTGFSTVYRYDGQMLDIVAMHNLPPAGMAAVRKAYPRPLTRDVGLSAMSIIDRTAYNVADVEQDPRVPEHMVKLTLDAGMRSVLFVPMIRQDVAIGAIGILRREAGAFTEKQIALLNIFADQAIIAIENVELFNETKRLLAESEEQVAELSTLNIISQGLVAQLDLQSVIDLVGDKIREILKPTGNFIALYEAQTNLIKYHYTFDPAGGNVPTEAYELGPGMNSIIIRSRQPLVLDTYEQMIEHGMVWSGEPGAYQSFLGVPVIIAGEVKGVMGVVSSQPHAYTEADVRLLTTVAANMGVAVENARLFDEIQRTNQDLSQTLEELKSTQGQLVEAEKMAALGGLVAGVAHEINTPVGVGVTAASTLQDKTTGFSEIYKSGQMKRSELEKYLNIAEQSSAMILRNLERAAELIQSFKQVAVDQSSEERRKFPIKAYLEEILLSLRPKLKKTQHTIEIKGDDSLTLDSYPGAFAQIVTNLVMNSLLHAYGPEEWGQLTFDFKQTGSRLTFEYNDDGKGIPTENLSKIFEPFFTTKRTQGGSGLGLHIIYNLVTQRLGGTINCESEVGNGTKFIIEVPVA